MRVGANSHDENPTTGFRGAAMRISGEATALLEGTSLWGHSSDRVLHVDPNARCLMAHSSIGGQRLGPIEVYGPNGRDLTTEQQGSGA